MVVNLIVKFLKSFVLKYFGAVAIEKIVIILLGELVKSTKSDVDDRIYNEVFRKLKDETKEKLD